MSPTKDVRSQKEDDLTLFPDIQGRSGDSTEGQLAVDVHETDAELIVKAAIAGVRPEELDVFVHNDMLTIRGSRHDDEEITEGKLIVRECHWGSFSRSLILPVEVDADRIAATLKDGILTIRMPKIERTKRIVVQER